MKPTRPSHPLILACLGFALAGAPAEAVELRTSGFGDITFGQRFGEAADDHAAEDYRDFGTDPIPLNTNQGFGLVGTDFIVIADLTNDLSYLAEVNFQTFRGGSSEFELDVERVLLDYQIAMPFNLQTGLFFTPIGLYNRFLYSRAWLVHSVQVPDLFEEEFNFQPSHTTGLMIYGGTFLGENGLILNYSTSVGNGRGIVPDETVYARAHPPDSDLANTVPTQYTGLVELLIPGFKVSRVGTSVWTDSLSTAYISSYDCQDGGGVEEVDLRCHSDYDPEDALHLREVGVDSYASIDTRRFSLFVEHVYMQHTDVDGVIEDGPGTYRFNGVLAEASLHLAQRKVHPYVRYDRTKLPEEGGGPYWSLRKEEDNQYELERVYVPEFNGIMTGVAWDAHRHARLKAEYGYNLGGPRPIHSITLQTGFGF